MPRRATELADPFHWQQDVTQAISRQSMPVLFPFVLRSCGVVSPTLTSGFCPLGLLELHAETLPSHNRTAFRGGRERCSCFASDLHSFGVTCCGLSQLILPGIARLIKTYSKGAARHTMHLRIKAQSTIRAQRCRSRPLPSSGRPRCNEDPPLPLPGRRQSRPNERCDLEPELATPPSETLACLCTKNIEPPPKGASLFART